MSGVKIPKMKSDWYDKGKRAARSAIAAGVPRWGVLRVAGSPSQEGGEIDPRTGLPLFVVHVPEALAPQQSEFIRGHNEEIAAGISSGEVTRDFRPLLMSRADVENEFEVGLLGRLDLNTAQTTVASRDVVLEIEVPKARRGRSATSPRDRPSWIVRRPGGGAPQRLLVYDGPVEVAVVRDGRILILRGRELDLVVDSETGQVLNRYVTSRH